MEDGDETVPSPAEEQETSVKAINTGVAYRIPVNLKHGERGSSPPHRDNPLYFFPEPMSTSPILPATDENIRKAASIIKRGGIVAFPTETVYGLGADALNEKAVARIFEAKERPLFDPLIVHIASREQLKLLTDEISDVHRKLMDAFWPGPLTIVFKKSPAVPYITTGGLDTVAVRMPSHPVALKLIRYSGRPIAAPSANRFGYPSPTRAEHVYRQLGDRVDLILDAGRTPHGIESTVIYVEGDTIYLLRAGATPPEDIEEITGLRVVRKARKMSPGQLPYHYSPLTPVILIERLQEVEEILRKFGRIALITFSREELPEEWKGKVIYDWLSQEGDLREAASNLFDKMHRYDEMNLDAMVFQRAPDEGLGIAINERLEKASRRYLKENPDS